MTVLLVSACGSEDEIILGQEAETLVLTESLRIGDEATGDSVYFVSIDDIAVDSRGQIFVSDNSNPGFRVFSAQGVLLHSIGSEGEGPGEFQQTPSLYIGAQDSVHAFDSDIDRLTTYSPDDYGLVRMTRISNDPSSRARPTEILAVMPDQLVVHYEHTVPIDTEEDDDGIYEVKLLDRDGQVIQDSLALIPGFQETIISASGFTIRLLRIFGRESFMVWGADDHIYMGWNDKIQIRRVPLDGSRISEFSIPHSPVEVTLNEKQTESSQYPNGWDVQFYRDMPDTKPAFNAMVPDDMGRLWIQLSHSENALQSEWIIIAPSTGNIVAKTSLPVTAKIMDVRQGIAYGILKENEVVVLAWRITS